jgi:hypothetical protein
MSSYFPAAAGMAANGIVSVVVVRMVRVVRCPVIGSPCQYT